MTAPDPTEWDESSAGIFDDADTKLIDIDLTALCSSPCQPPAPAPAPVPRAAAGILSAIFLVAGAAYLYWRRAPLARGQPTLRS